MAYPSIAAKLKEKNVTLVAVSKTQPVSALMELYNVGQRHFGENKVQEMLLKQEQLPADIHWHLIGHLQRNKVRYIAPFVHLIHSVDSLLLLQEIDKQAAKASRTIDCLLQIFIATEETKFGLSLDELYALLQSPKFAAMKHIRIRGLMGMASNVEDKTQVQREFHSLRRLFDQTKSTYFLNDQSFDILSMGMSADHDIAISEGATMVRIGSLLF
ncbi:YggS family pyridoxal phosphate-dependent enzyme [soil metagenome]